MEEPTQADADGSGHRRVLHVAVGQAPRLQILTVEDLLTGKGIDRPPAQTSVTFKRAPKAKAHGRREGRKRPDFAADSDDSPEYSGLTRLKPCQLSGFQYPN